MVKYGIGVVVLLMVCGCTGSPAKDPPGEFEQAAWREMVFFNTPSLRNELIFVGVASIRFNHQESVQAALEDAAKKVAFFYAVEGMLEYREEKGLGFLDYNAERKTSLNLAQDYLQYLEALEYDPETDILVDELAVFVRTRHRVQKLVSHNHVFSSKTGKPQWVENPPTNIAGLHAGVGYANPRQYHKDTVIASYENAVHTIIRNISSDVRSGVETRKDSQDTLNSIDAKRSGTVFAQGKLTGFYVLEIWVDPKNRGVWTLAIAEEGTAIVREVSAAIEAQENPGAEAEL
ncbi:MAG: hypothetical protein LBT13_01115 [Treponema sp.]|jgi:hypothetical protein|nr:hypothetical protein [Treponema sp.]